MNGLLSNFSTKAKSGVTPRDNRYKPLHRNKDTLKENRLENIARGFTWPRSGRYTPRDVLFSRGVAPRKTKDYGIYDILIDTDVHYMN